jgi:hypothetical protein
MAQPRLAERHESGILGTPAASVVTKDDPDSSLIGSVVELLRKPPELMRRALEEAIPTDAADLPNDTTAPPSLFDEYTLGGKTTF